MKPKVPTDFTRRLLTTAAAVIGLAPVAFAQASGAQAAETQTFFVLNNPNDPMFNQLLGINNGNVIVGYFGDGMAVANNGYVLVPANHYSIENFTAVANCTAPPSTLFPMPPCPPQTQAIGINSATGLAGATPFPDIVGFYIDIAGFTHGFVDSFGVQSTIDDPAGLPPNVTTPVQNLLGINNALRAAGFWTDNAGHEHGFVTEINTQTTPVAARFTEFTPAKVSADLGVAAVATQTSDITNNNLVCGFWTDANDINHGFEVFFNTAAHSFNRVLPLTANPAQIPNVKSLSPLGCNDNGAVVGTFTANDGTVHGFVFDGTDWHNYDAAGSSQTAAFKVVMGTTINGINNAGNVVGFFSDGENVNGFVDFEPVP
jgi:probable HAF family extracellular repeat protein